MREYHVRFCEKFRGSSLYLLDLRKFNSKKFTFKENFIRIDADHIFSSREEFETVTDLVLKIKKIN